MSDKVCDCQFCKDYKRFQEVLPLVPAEHQAWFESIFDALWNAQEELSYKAAILDGTWPSSVEILEHHLANARKRNEVVSDCPEYAHDCNIVDISDGPCGDPSHDEPAPSVLKAHHGRCSECDEGVMIERTNSNTGYTFLGCSEFPDCKHTTAGGANPSPTSQAYDYDDEMDDEDPWHCGSEHMGDFS